MAEKCVLHRHNCHIYQDSTWWIGEETFIIGYCNRRPPSEHVMKLVGKLPSICHRTYFHTSKGHVTWIIKKLIGLQCILVGHMRVSARLLEVT